MRTRALALALLAALPLAAAPSDASHLPTAGAAGADVLGVAYAFAPHVVTASPGETVTWNSVLFVHTVTALSGEFDLHIIDGEVKGWTVPADAPSGPIVYYCRYHLFQAMIGVVVVV